jgi:hypothetical protein
VPAPNAPFTCPCHDVNVAGPVNAQALVLIGVRNVKVTRRVDDHTTGCRLKRGRDRFVRPDHPEPPVAFVAKYIVPSPAAAIAPGEKICVELAGRPSPLNPGTPVPAIVAMRPAAKIVWMRSLF